MELPKLPSSEMLRSGVRDPAHAQPISPWDSNGLSCMWPAVLLPIGGLPQAS